MRKIFFLLSFFVASVLNAQVVPHDLLPSKPASARPVVDEAGILTDGEESQLVAKLKAYNDSTSNQIVIVTVKSLHGYESDQYANEIGHYWGVGGQAKYDNGVVILVSTGTGEENGKKKVFIAPGYGLEGALPAITCKKITDYEMVPSLKAGNYYEAFDKAITAIIKAAAGEYKAPDAYKKKSSGDGAQGIIAIVVIGIIILILIARGRGGGGSGMMGRRGFGNVAEGLFWASILSGNSGGGGGSSSNDDSGSGGFGDFGGGDFGGGGAGSDW